MTGRIRYVREKGKSPAEVERLWGLELLTVTVYEPPGMPPRRLEKVLARTGRLFRREGVSRVLLPPDFPHGPQLGQVRPVDCLPFLHAMADLLALGWLETRGLDACRSQIALTGPRVSPELRAAALRLCPAVQGLRIDVPGGEGEWFARELQWEFGLPVLPPGTPADLTLSFGPGEGDLCLWGAQPRLGGLELYAQGMELPEEYHDGLLTLLWERGSVGREEIRVRKRPEFV